MLLKKTDALYWKSNNRSILDLKPEEYISSGFFLRNKAYAIAQALLRLRLIAPEFRRPRRQQERLVVNIALDKTAHDSFHMERSFIGHDRIIGRIDRL